MGYTCLEERIPFLLRLIRKPEFYLLSKEFHNKLVLFSDRKREASSWALFVGVASPSHQWLLLAHDGRGRFIAAPTSNLRGS